MTQFIYCCSQSIVDQLNIKYDDYLYDHGVKNNDQYTFLFPLNNTNKTINPKNYSKIKNKYQLKSLVLIDRVYTDTITTRAIDHVNKTGQSFLRGNTPYENLPTFPDISKIYNSNKGKIFVSVGEKKPLNITVSKNEILSEWIAMISPVWHYIGVNIIGIGINKKIKSTDQITI